MDALNLDRLRVAIIGCGPGGMAAALMLSRAGHSVTIFEQFDAPSPVGSGLLIQPTGQAVLGHLGLLKNAEALSHPVRSLHGISVLSGKRALDMEYAHARSKVPALGIHRASLFSVLMDAVRGAGIPIITGRKLKGFEERAGGIVPSFEKDAEEEAFDLMIDATGARSPVRSGKTVPLPFGAFWGTVDMPENHEVVPDALDQRYRKAARMAGIMPIGYNPATGNQGAAVFWSEKPENVDAVMVQGIDTFRDQFCDLWPAAEPFVQQIRGMDDLTFAKYSHRTGRAFRSPKLIHVGDSWHSTSPQLGQGANMALIDAAALAKAVEDAREINGIAPGYLRARRFHISLYQKLSFAFTPLYQSDGWLLPATRDFAIHHFARLPLVRNFIAQTVSGSLGLGKT